MRPIQDFFRIVLLIASSIIPFTALPTSTIGPGNIDARLRARIAPPTLDACKAQLRVPPDTTLFYSGGPSYYQKALDAVKTRAYLDGYEIMAQKWRDDGWKDAWQVDEDVSRQFWDVCSRALAEATSGLAYVLLPPGKGTRWANGTVWDRVEWPSLAEDVEVIRINPDDPDEQEFIKFGTDGMLD